jgi:hypothetical protein
MNLNNRMLLLFDTSRVWHLVWHLAVVYLPRETYSCMGMTTRIEYRG